MTSAVLGGPDGLLSGRLDRPSSVRQVTYLVTRSRMVILRPNGDGSLAMRLDRALPPAVNEDGDVWLTSTRPQASMILSSPWIGFFRQQRGTESVRFESLADPQKAHDIIVAAQLAQVGRDRLKACLRSGISASR